MGWLQKSSQAKAAGIDVMPDFLRSFLYVPKGVKWSNKVNATAEILERCMPTGYGRFRHAEIVQPSADIFTL